VATTSGATVQVIPHVTNEIKSRIHRVAREAQAEVVVLSASDEPDR